MLSAHSCHRTCHAERRIRTPMRIGSRSILRVVGLKAEPHIPVGRRKQRDLLTHSTGLVMLNEESAYRCGFAAEASRVSAVAPPGRGGESHRGSNPNLFKILVFNSSGLNILAGFCR